MISDRLKKIICDELYLDPATVNISDETQAPEVPGWDSLNHANIIVAIEKDYGVRFKGLEVLKCNDVGALQRLIDSKVSK
ncbi:MAG: acyl carrier protein [Bacteroidetes bacterium]|nr:acyl carrier protein [Bacteroidota bacterium]MBU1114871.1 acyl carrier protein [Bacteroidota bacterium]MBU1799837.1 acyl carrier protein [Bacteroidota bacterium]